MSLNITNLYYTEENIGLNLHISKKQYIWGFELDDVPQHIKLLDSRISHKKRLYKNGKQILNIKQKGDFSHTFEIDGHTLVIIQYADKIELRIDNESFAHLYNLQKNRELLKGDNGPTSKISIKNYNTISYSQEENDKNNSVFYKNNVIKKENPKLFNFKIKKESGNKSLKINNKFKFGEKKEKIFEPSLSNSNDNKQNNNNSNNNNKNVNLLGFENTIENSYKINPVNLANNNNILYDNKQNNNNSNNNDKNVDLLGSENTNENSYKSNPMNFANNNTQYNNININANHINDNLTQ